MTAPIAPIAGIAPVASLGAAGATSAVGSASALSGAASATGTAAATSSGAAAGSDFATALGNGLDAVSSAQANANNLAIQAATGQLTDPATLTIATTQATLMTQLASAVQSKAIAAFNTIMGLQA